MVKIAPRIQEPKVDNPTDRISTQLGIIRKVSRLHRDIHDAKLKDELHTPLEFIEQEIITDIKAQVQDDPRFLDYLIQQAAH